MKKVLLVCLCCIPLMGMTQKLTIQGQLVDSVNNPLPSATILILNVNDSSLVNFGLTGSDGKFLIRGLAPASYFMKATFVGFSPLMMKVAPASGMYTIDVGTLKLRPVANELEAIEIAADRAPVVIKKDTIEFNAASFKTKQNANVEELLKKLPGVEVDNNGNITSQGEQVQRVTVDGKNFFGTDPKLATRNLPADAIDKVQVFDKKSDQAAFSGIDDGQREKTINLELKPEKRKGVFGSLTGGIGTQDRFNGKLSLNQFTKSRQLALLGMANNTNEPGFSMEEYLNFTGGSQRMMSGGAVRLEFNGDNDNGVPMNFGNRSNGILSTYGAGLNLNNEFNKKTEINGSYFFNYIDHQKTETTDRTNFLPDGNYVFNQVNRQNNSNINHRANTTLDHKIDSMNSLKLTVNASLNTTDSNLSASSSTMSEDGLIANDGERSSFATGETSAVISTLLWRHKFGKKGRTLSTTFSHRFSDADQEGILTSVNNFYDPTERTVVLNQTNSQETVNTNYAAGVSYTEPLGGRKYLEANYSYRLNLNDVDRKVFDGNNGEWLLNDNLSNQYNSAYAYHKGGANFRIVRSNFNVVAGTAFQQTELHGRLIKLDSEIGKTFQNILPSLRFKYDFSSTKHLHFDYETSVQEPGITQLQPVLDNSDPLNQYIGNPALKPSYNQSWRLNFTTFDPMSFLSFFAFADADYTTNAIVNSQSIDASLVRLTTPVNVSDNFRFTSNAHLAFPVNAIASRFSFGTNYGKQKSLTILNDMENEITQHTYGAKVSYNYQLKEIWTIDLSADIDRQISKFDFEQPDQSFLNRTFSAESNLTFFKSLEWNSTFEYLIYENTGTGFRQTLPLLNMAVSGSVLRNKAGQLKLSVHNLLDRALGVTQSATFNYVEQVVSNSLGRYFMLSFTYALNRQLNPVGMRKGARMMRIIR